MSRELIVNTADRFIWRQIGAAMHHPEHGKVIDISSEINKEQKIDNADVKIYCHTSYGNIPVLREVLGAERPDAMMLFTDPRHWMWFWPFEHELHTKYKIPLVYLSIWDHLPYPYYNSSFYASCDALFAISKQTHNIHKEVLNYHNTPWVEFHAQ